jgi:hypothetical protein
LRKGATWLAIKASGLSPARTDDGGFTIEASGLFIVFHPKRDAQRSQLARFAGDDRPATQRNG